MNNLSENPTVTDRTFVNGKQLAELLDVAPPTLSEAVKKGYNCKGHPVSDWAEFTNSGRVKGYHVPRDLVSDNPEETEIVENPIGTDSNKPKEKPNKVSEETVDEVETEASNNNISLLPSGEDYVKPVGLVALSSTLNKALEQDTPNSRAVVSILLTVVGAITGHIVTDNSIGAGAGAFLGLGIAYTSYQNFDPAPQKTAVTSFEVPDISDQEQLGESKESSRVTDFRPNWGNFIN